MATGYTNVVDGLAHTIDVTVTNLEGYDYEITYSETEEGMYTTEKPSYTEAGDYTVWFKIVSDGCATVKDKAGVRLDSIEGYVYRTRIDGGGWTYHDELADVANVISQECYQARQAVIDVEMLQDDTTTFDRALNFGYGASGKGTAHQTRYVNFRSCPLLKTRFMLKKAATAARFNLRCHGPATYWTFDNVTLDGGAKWSDPDDPLSTAQEEDGIGAGQFIDMDNSSYLNHIVLTNMTLRNCQMPATTGSEPSGLFYMSYNASSLTLEAGTEVVDCRGGLLVSFIRRMAGLVLRGGTITRCGGGASGLFFLKGHSGAPKTDPVGARAICGTVITNNRVTASGVFTGDALARYHLSGAPIVTANYLADGTTPANIRAESHTNVIVTGALTSPAESVGVSSPDATKFGDVFAVLDSGVAGEGLAAFRFDTADTAVALQGALSAGGEPVWTNGTIRVITYEKADWEGYVDGKAHAPQIVVRAPATAVASYALDPAGPWSAEKPQLTAVGNYTVYVKIVAPNCPDVTDSVKVTVHDESYVPANKWRVRIEGGAWQDAADWAAVETILAQLYYTTDLTAEVELMSLTEALDREVTLGAYESGKTKHSDKRRITVRTRADNGQRYTIRRTAQDARFRYSGHGMTAISFENIVLDGGAKWADAVDLTSLTQLEGGVAAHTDDFLTRGSYASSFTFATNSVFRNFAFSASHGIRSLTSVGDDAVNILPGALVTDCRGGPLVNYARHTGNLTVGGEITRCSSPNSLFNLSTSTGVLGYKHGSHIVTNGCVRGNVVGNSGNVVSVDKYCFVEFGGAPVLTDNRRVNGTVANVCAGGTSNLVLTTALDAAGGARVGVRIGSTLPYKPVLGTVFGSANGFTDDASRVNPAAAFYPEDRPVRIGAVAGGQLVWVRAANGLVISIK